MTRKLQSNNRSGLSGLRLVLSKSHGMARPVLYVQVSWRSAGRLCNTHFSTALHGPIRATALAMERREQGTGQAMGLTPRGAWMRMRAAQLDLVATAKEHAI